MKALLLLAVLAKALNGQSFLDAKVARGDNLRWADPAFDDSSWPTVRERQSHVVEDSAWNRLWLRMRVEIPVGEPAVVLVYRCSCEVFLNGVKLGGTGNLDETRPAAVRGLRAFDVPAATPGGTALLAVREYFPPGRDLSVPFWATRQAVRVEPRSRLLAAGDEVRADDVYPLRILIYSVALGGMVVALISARRDSTVLALMVYVAMALANAILSWSTSGEQSITSIGVLLFIAWTSLPLHYVLWRFAGPLPWSIAGAYGLALLFRLPLCVAYLLAQSPWWTPISTQLYRLGYLLLLVLAFGAVVRGWRRGAPFVLLLAGFCAIFLGILGRVTAGAPLAGRGTVDTLASMVFTAMATAHVFRETRARRSEEQRLRREMESAQTVQALLLSQQLPAGVDAVYMPASEVGGDFYQAFETPSGRLVVTGDVSGKGLQAAMRVSTIIGALRNRQSDAPSAVLAELNRVLAGSPGFTTCCCALFPPQGPVRLANAGHPPPYADGRELEVATGLPLGLVTGVPYDESTATGSRFTFVSDGVVEAENPQRELFGFDRTRDLSTQPAQQIAGAAKAWGQNDDITVVTVRSMTQ